MSRTLTATVLGALVAGAFVVGAAVPADAGGPISVRIKKPNGTPVSEISLAPGAKKSMQVIVKNLSVSGSDFILADSAPISGGWTKRWFRGSRNITNAVTNEGYEVHLPNGVRKEFRVKLKRADPSTGAGCVNAQMFEGPTLRGLGVLGVNQPATDCI